MHRRRKIAMVFSIALVAASVLAILAEYLWPL